ncbi:MAG: DVUA0089 family protein [Phycisphaerales bacterium]|nr:DVUA0089 family protein [Phycisphaerales bacterium]
MKTRLMALALAACAGTVFASPRESQVAPTPLDSDDPGGTFNMTFANSDGGGAYTAFRVRFTGMLTSNVGGTYAQEVAIDVTPPGGAVQTFLLGAGFTYSTQSFDIVRTLAAPVATGGTWTFALRETYDDAAGIPDSTVSDLVVTLDDAAAEPPTHTNLGTLVDGVPVSQEVVLEAGEVKWFKVTTAEASEAAHRKLDINTLASTFGGDSEIGVYTSTGTGLFANDDAGGGLYSQLTFGEEGAAGTLAAGTYFVAVSSYNATFLVADWTVTSTGPGGTFQLTLAQTVFTPPVGIWSESADGGGDAGQELASAQVVSGTGDLPRITGSFGVDDVDIYKINICDTVSFSASTAGTAPVLDTQLFLFNADGTGVVMNDDNTLGGGGLWSALDNTTGFIAAAGDYYLAISRYDIDPTSGGLEIWADTPFAAQRQPDGANAAGILDGWIGANAATGNYRIDFTGTCRVGAGPACGLADVGGVGGAPGADNHLDNNDFVVFIDYFFTQNPIADQGSTGGAPGADGSYDNNDFIVFIDNFFNAPASCR